MPLNGRVTSQAQEVGESWWPVLRCERERWRYEGRQVVEGQDCYVWKRYIDMPGTEVGFRVVGYAHPVATFWPGL